ncbi:hypothetical protein ACQPZF_18495 [Actinosynnema sp. CS-041913]|uniref:hypothetical protein n=1 Tax=Actinosynnema sp. CS-041913 TaxID=3239917 RepID=UPI003D908B2D
MSAATPDPDQSESDNSAGWGDPTREARMRVEKSGLKVEVAVPSSQAPRLLATAVHVVVMIGVVLCPALTLRVIPPDFPTWATVAVIAGQIGLLGLVALVVRRPTGSAEGTRR